MEPEHHNDPVESFLHKHATDGTLEQTAASFTVHLSKAREKMSRFALDAPGLWVVKLAQAAVACGAPDVRFTFGRRKVTVKFANKGHWRADEILSGLAAVELPAKASLFHWTIGLLTVANRWQSALAWSCGGQEVTLTGEASLLESVPDDQMVKLEVYRGRNTAAGPDFWTTPIRYHFKDTGHEFKALVDRCRCSPIPVYVDNYVLPRGYLTKSNKQKLVRTNQGEINRSVRGITLAVLPLRFRSGHGLGYPLNADEDFEPLPQLMQAMRGRHDGVPTATDEIGAVLALHTFNADSARIHYVCDGALVDEQRWRSANSLASGMATPTFNWGPELYLSVDHRRLDLSQFRVRDDASLDQLDLELCGTVASVMDGLVKVCPLGWRLPTATRPEGSIFNTSPNEVLLAGVALPFLGTLAVIGPVVMIGEAWRKSQAVFNTHCRDFKLVHLALRQARQQLRALVEENKARSE